MGEQVFSGLQEKMQQVTGLSKTTRINNWNGSGFHKLISSTRVCFPDAYVCWRKGQL